MISEDVKRILERAGVPFSDIWTLEMQAEEALKKAMKCDLNAIKNFRSLTLFYRRISDKLNSARKS